MKRAIHYQSYLAEDFAADPEFIEWILNPDEKKTELWESWLSANPDKAQEVKLAVQLIRLVIPQYYHAKEGVQQEIWEKIFLNVRLDSSHKSHPFYQSVPLWKNLTRVAAVFIGLLFLAGIVYQLVETRNTINHATGPKETKTIQLPDGSEVVLNINSFLSYHKNWDKNKERKVHLKGEAFFSVVHKNNNQQFFVDTQDAGSIEVIGTKFNVLSYKKKTQVVLNQGKVLFSTGGNDPDIEMKPGEFVEVIHQGIFIGNKVTKRNVNPDVYRGWVDGRFVFDHTSLSEIADIIESNYDYQVEFGSGEIEVRALTLMMPKRDLNLLLKTICVTHDLTLTKKGNKLLFTENAGDN